MAAVSSSVKLFCIKMWPRRNTAQHGRAKTQETLAGLVLVLDTLKEGASASGVPFFPLAANIASAIVNAARVYTSNQEDLERLAKKVASLAKLVADRLDADRSQHPLPEKFNTFIEELSRKIKEMTEFIERLSSKGKIRRFVASAHVKDKIQNCLQDLNDAQQEFQTSIALYPIPNQPDAPLDNVYKYGQIEGRDFFDNGEDWMAVIAVLRDDSARTVIVKRYIAEDPSKRQTMWSRDLSAFKREWSPAAPQYVGSSSKQEEWPFHVLSGVSSDHVNVYIARLFSENNYRGSIEVINLISQLTRAFSFMLKRSRPTLFDISKVYLSEAGKITLVDLEPSATTVGSINDMPHWLSWQNICVELLSGKREFEPNPAVDSGTDPATQRRIEYLQPLLGLIHAGGLRFKDSIERSFRTQITMLHTLYLKVLPSTQQMSGQQRSTVFPESILSPVLSDHSAELHYVAHYHEPLEVNAGDIGYIRGNPPRFTRLLNVAKTLCSDSDYAALSRKPGNRHLPQGRWRTETVNGVTRHEFRLLASDASSLADYDNGRTGVDKDFFLQRLNRASKAGLVVDCASSWKALREHAAALVDANAEHNIGVSNLVLIAFFKQQSGYASLRLNRKLEPDEWLQTWKKEGFDAVPDSLYFYESPPRGSDGVWGYFSFSAEPGTPHRSWTPTSAEDGESWGWSFVSEDWAVEISKPNVKQYIRYVQLP